jgi:hypothetical protein
VPTDTSPLLINLKEGSGNFGIVRFVHRAYFVTKEERPYDVRTSINVILRRVLATIVPGED